MVEEKLFLFLKSLMILRLCNSGQLTLKHFFFFLRMIYLKGRTGERQREKERGQRQREYSCLLAHYSDGHSDRAGEVAAVSREYLLGLSWVQGAHALVSSSRLAAGSWMKSGIGKTCTDSPMGYWSAQVVAFTHSAHWLHLCS